MLASLKTRIGRLDRVNRVVRLFGYGQCAPGFDRMPEVMRRRVRFLLRVIWAKGRPAMRGRLSEWQNCRRYPGEINGEFELKT